MKKQFISLVIICMSTVVIFTGCTEQQETAQTNKDVPDIGANDSFSVDSTGGDFSLFDGAVQVTVESGVVTSKVDFAVEAIADPVGDSSLYMLCCYHFDPETQTFDQPINLILQYNIADLPVDLEESDIKVYALHQNNWELIESSYADQTNHYAVAQVSQLSTVGCGVPSTGGSTGGTSGGSGSSNSSNGSAQYWFKANLYTYQYASPRLVDWADSDTYYCGVSAYWDPVPYVQYYQLKFVFNGHEPAVYGWSCDFRNQGHDYCNNGPLNRVEGYIYQYGGDPNVDGFLGVLQNGECTAGVLNEATGEVETTVFARKFPEQKHGWPFIAVHDEVEDYEGLSGTDITILQSQMETFVLDYISGWEVWVRGVTETIG